MADSILRMRSHVVSNAVAGTFVLFFATSEARLQAQEAESMAPTFDVIYNFTGGADGSEYSSTYGAHDKDLIRDEEGNLYGTAPFGGDLGAFFGVGCGVVFKVDPAGKQSVVYSFTGGADGCIPLSGLIRDKEGTLYGTTASGGTYQEGTVFRVNRSGQETVLHTFTGGADGAQPAAGLVGDDGGNLYGTAALGGSGFGTVFKLEPCGTFSVLYTFTGGTDGGYPTSTPVLDDWGNLYSTTFAGGSGSGVVFELNREGKETVLHTFTAASDADGYSPEVGVIRDEEGNLYGTTSLGGNTGPTCGAFGCGVVFKISSQSKFTVFHTFTGVDGSGPNTRLIRDNEGNFYGTTQFGGPSGAGVVYKLDRSGEETVLYTFEGSSTVAVDGYNPDTGLVWDKGSLYGATEWGGTYDWGVVYKLTP